MRKTLPPMVDVRLAAAMTHPTRVHAMTVFVERVASPKEIAAELHEPVNNVTYHVNQLLKLGCIELVKENSAQGGRVVEHFYRAAQRPYFDNDAWAEFGQKEKMDVTSSIVQLISEDIAVAMTHGTFFEPDDNHMSRTPMVVDREGWNEVNALLDETLLRLFEIQDRCVNRRTGDDDEESMHIKAEMIAFQSPPPKSA